MQYGKPVTKTVKTFEATWRPAGGRIRVVIVPAARRLAAVLLYRPRHDGPDGPGGDGRSGAIEQTFKDVKEVWGAGQQQVRNVYASIGAFAVNLTLYSVVEAWAWSRPEEGLMDRSRSPWDAEERRPSHADKRKALQREILREEIRRCAAAAEAAGDSGTRHAPARSGRLIIGISRKGQATITPAGYVQTAAMQVVAASNVDMQGIWDLLTAARAAQPLLA